MTFKRNISILGLALAVAGAGVASSFAAKNDNPHAAKLFTQKEKDSYTFKDLSSNGVMKLKFQDDFKKLKTSGEGIDGRTFDSANFRATEYFFKKGAQIGLEDHDTDQIGYIVSGDLHFIFGTDEKSISYVKGDYFIIPAHIKHSANSKNGAHFITFNPAATSNKNSSYRH